MNHQLLPSHEIKEPIGHTERGTTVVSAFKIDTNGDGETAIPLAALLDDLNELMEQIPPEHRDSAKLNVKAYGDYASADVSVIWTRPETNEELSARRRWLQSIDDEREASDRSTFERLKQKFNSSHT
jgi:hypothetical protein